MMDWIDVEKELPPPNSAVLVIVQEVMGGSPRKHCRIEITTFTNMNRLYNSYFNKVESGIVRYWKPVDDMPEGFKQISGLALWEKEG